MSKTRQISPLATYERISPNSTNPRASTIRRSTPHCVAGNLTIEATLGLARFINADPKGGASCNYAIGTDGRIGLGVEEANRSWCTSSRTNDHESITVEIANNGGAPDWRMSDAAINAWLDLTIEQIRFYGFKKVNYQPKPANVTTAQVETWISTWAKKDEWIITLHCWYAAKACPGPYFIRQLPWLVKEMNKRLQDPNWIPEAFVGEGVTQTGSTSESSQNESKVDATVPILIVPENIDKIIWNFLKDQGLNDFAIAGIMGNLFAESGLSPIALQNTFEKTLNHTDKSYTLAVDDGSYINFAQDKAGYGLAQWTWHTRKQALLDFAKKSGASIGELEMQLMFMWNEMKEYKQMIKDLTSSKSIIDASTTFLVNYEKPADQSSEVQKKRAEFGQKYFDKFAPIVAGSSSSKPKESQTAPIQEAFKEYMIRVTAQSLNVRTGPGTNYPVTRTLVNDKNLYTIVEEHIKDSGNVWGRLKSGIGWINLAFTERK